MFGKGEPQSKHDPTQGPSVLLFIQGHVIFYSVYTRGGMSHIKNIANNICLYKRNIMYTYDGSGLFKSFRYCRSSESLPQMKAFKGTINQFGICHRHINNRIWLGLSAKCNIFDRY